MDVNGTRFHLVIGRADWLGDGVAVRPSDGLEWHDADHTLRLTEVPFIHPERTGNRRLRPEDRRGAARDGSGHWYWIGPDRDEVLFQAADSRKVERFWPRPQPCDPPWEAPGPFVAKRPAPVTAPRFGGLAVTADHRLIVGAPDLPGVLVFDLHAGGPPSPLVWPTPLSPIDMAPAPGGGVWILDGPSGPGAFRYWGLDRHLRICNLADAAPPEPPSDDFSPKDPDRTGGAATATATAAPTPAAVDAAWAVAIESLPDGSVLVLDRGDGAGSTLLRYDGASGPAPRLPLPALGQPPIDVAFLPASRPDSGTAGTVFVIEQRGDQAFAFALAPDASSITRLVRFLPMRLFTGKGLVRAGDQVYYDMGTRWLPLIDRRRPRHRNRAVLELSAFTADEPGSVWHRLTIDACLPPGTGVAVASRASDDPDMLAQLPWRDEPALYRRGRASELPYHRFGADDADESGTWELLFQRAVGRHLQLQLTLTGDGHHTPRLWALRAHVPRFSYLEAYLPDVYRQEPDAASFLDRYLANVEGMFTTLEGRIAETQVLFRATTVQAEYLGWLAGWLGAVLDPDWGEARKRLFVQHAFTLFSRRGTPRGLLEAVRLATDPCPDTSIFTGSDPAPFGVRIVEAFRTRSVPGVVYGDPTDLAGPRLVPVGDRWRLSDGGAELDRRWRAFVRDRHGTVDAVERAWGRPVAALRGLLLEPFGPLTPQHTTEAADRRDFIAGSLSVTYADVGSDDAASWRTFVAQRHRRVEDLNTAWERVGDARISSFDDVELPTGALPPDGHPLRDWIQFVSTHLPARRAAHTFTVLVPVRPDEPDHVRADRIRRVEQVVAAQRPAHTAASVEPYWAAFRVGEARVGYETRPGEGSRFVAMVLGEGRTAHTYLRGRHPWHVPDRWVVGRERVGADVRDSGQDTEGDQSDG